MEIDIENGTYSLRSESANGLCNIWDLLQITQKLKCV
jgi:hypothetical protein